jgi:hypothetical protein
VKETTTPQSTALDYISVAFQVFYFLVPSMLVEKFFPRGHYVLFTLKTLDERHRLWVLKKSLRLAVEWR